MRKVAIRFRGFGRLGAKAGPSVPKAPAVPQPRSSNLGRNLGIAGGAGAAGLGGAAYGGHQWLQGEGGQDWLYNRAWGGLGQQQRTDSALDYLEADRSGEDQGYFARQVSDDTKARIRGDATRHMMQGGIGDILGMSEQDRGTGAMLGQNWKQYLPLLLGLGLGAGGVAKRSPIMGILGLLAGGYGLKSIYDKGQTLRKEGPELMLMASGRTGSSIEQEAARERLRSLYSSTAPAYRLMDSLGVAPGLAKTGSAMNHLMDHFETSKMIDELRKDRGVDSRTAAEMITAIHNAQRIDSRPKSVLSVGEFATGAAGTALGFTLGARIGSLMSLRPQVKSTISRIGQGLFSGASRLGVL